MTCQELQDLIHRNLPERCAEAGLTEVQQHASTCPACAAALAKLLTLEDELKSLSGVEAEESLTQTVMNHIAAVSATPACGIRNRELLGVSLTAAGILVLLFVHAWTTNWSDELAKCFHASIGRGWAVILAVTQVEPRVETFLPMFLGAALIAMGLSCAPSETADFDSVLRPRS